MRKFDRATPPELWGQNEAKWNNQWVALVGKNPKAAFAWYVHAGVSSRLIAIPILKGQTGQHCSFCDGFPVEGISEDTIEHFRPKCATGFPQYAYSWGNLYYCCSCCQSHKREKWDDALIAPDDADYEFGRYFEFDFTTGAIRALPSADDVTRSRAEATIKLYGLDTEVRRRLRRLQLRIWIGSDLETRRLTEFAYRDFLEIPNIRRPAKAADE